MSALHGPYRHIYITKDLENCDQNRYRYTLNTHNSLKNKDIVFKISDNMLQHVLILIWNLKMTLNFLQGQRSRSSGSKLAKL